MSAWSVFSASRTNFTFTPGEHIMILEGNSDKRIVLLQVTLFGMGIASSPNEVQITRSIIEDYTDGVSFAALEPEGQTLSNVFAGWTFVVQPTVQDVLTSLVVNSDGGIAVWDYRHGEGDSPVSANRVGEHISFKAIQGAGPLSMTVLVGEYGN